MSATTVSKMKSFNVVLLLTFLLGFGQCRNLFSADLPQFSAGVLEEGKPIELDRNYKEVQISGIQGTLYSDSLSRLHNVTVLRIHDHQIDKIERGAVCAAPDLRTLELDFYDTNKPLVLSKQTFENCGKIEQLILKFNSRENETPRIEVDALENFTNLKELYIQGDPIPHLGKNFLKFKQNQLTHLALSFCNIQEIDSDAFEDLRKLEELTIIHNPLTTLPKNLFKPLSKLTHLNLRNNNLKDLSWDEFDGASSVVELYLSANLISSFNADKIAKSFPNLKTLFIDKNPPRCKETEVVVEKLKEKIKSLTHVTFKFDPGYYDSCEEP